MIISDLEHLETVREENEIEGGIAFADAFSDAYANGPDFTSTATSTFVFATVSPFFFGGSTSSSTSSASAAAF